MIDVGKPIRQAAEPHGRSVLGSGPSTIGQAGCLLCCLTMVARSGPGWRDLDVITAHVAITTAGGFQGSQLIVPIAAKALGMRLAGRGAFDLEVARQELSAGRPVVVGIDYKPGRSSGRSAADHFAVIVDDVDGDLLRIADPATGTLRLFDPHAPRYGGHVAKIPEMLRFAPEG